jgi:hypothetical protein
MSAPPKSTSVKNLLVPAFGATRVLQLNFPLVPDNTFSFNTTTLEDTAFLPQSVTVDATSVPTNQSAVFRIPAINFIRTVPGGTTETFQFPSVDNLTVLCFATDAISVVRTFFYNYPSFNDQTGPKGVRVISGAIDVSTVPGPTANVRTQMRFAVDNSAPPLSQNLITTTTTETILIHQIEMNLCGFSAALNDFAVRTSSGTAVNYLVDLAVPPASPNYITQVSRFVPNVPLRLPVGDDLVFIANVSSVYTGGLRILVDYQIV